MKFQLNDTITLLRKTPAVIKTFVTGLPDGFTHNNEGSETWSVYDVLGHLIEGEREDWIPRAKQILSDDHNDKSFKIFDRFAQFENSKGKSLPDLVFEFEKLRISNIEELERLNISDFDLTKTGIHPEFGKVTLQQLLSAWAAHDLGHILQISRVMAKQYAEEVGPWTKYLSLFHK